jgi:recombination protein U
MKKGGGLERYLDHLHANYARSGLAYLFKVPNPLNPLAPPGKGGIVRGHLMAAVWVDYSGLLKGGRAVAIEAKTFSTGGPSFPLKRITPHQIQCLTIVHELGGLAFLFVRHMKGGVDYLIPVDYLNDLDRRSFRWDAVARYALPPGRGWIDRVG